MENEQETLPPQEGGDQTPNNDGEQTPKNEELSNEMKTALAQKEHFRAKAEKLEAENKKLVETKSQSGSIDPLEVVKLGQSVKDFSADELDFIMQNAKGGAPKDIMEAANNEMVKLAIQAKREKVEKEKALSPSSKQEITDRPKSIDEFMKTGDEAEVEKWLVENNLYKPPHRRHNPKAFNSNY